MLVSIVVMVTARYWENIIMAAVSYSAFMLFTWLNMQMFINLHQKSIAVKLLHITLFITAIAPVIILSTNFDFNAVWFYPSALLMWFICLESKYKLSGDEKLRTFVGRQVDTAFVFLVIMFLASLAGAFLTESTTEMIQNTWLLCGWITVLLINGQFSSIFTHTELGKTAN